MNCEEFQQQLDAVIAERTAHPAGELSEHAVSCSTCRVAWEDFLFLENAIAQWKQQVRTVDLTERLFVAWRQSSVNSESTACEVAMERVPSSPVRRRLWPMLLPLVGAIALAFIAVMFRGASVAPGPQQAQQQRLDKSLAPPSEQFADLSEIMEDAKSAWLGLARSTAARTQDLSVFIPTLTSASDDAMPPMMIDMNMSDEINSGTAPVPDELRRAFEILLDAAEWSESQTT